MPLLNVPRSYFHKTIFNPDNFRFALCALAAFAWLAAGWFVKSQFQSQSFAAGADVARIAAVATLLALVAFAVFAQRRRQRLRLAQQIELREKTENDLRICEAGRRQLFENSPLPMWVYDLRTLEILQVNQAAAVHYGFSEAEFRALTIKDLCVGEDEPALSDIFDSITPVASQTRLQKHRKQNGDLIDVQMISQSYVLNGRQTEIVRINDITALKRTEAALIESAAEMRALFAAMTDTIVVFDCAGRYVKIAPTNQTLIVRPTEELIGKTLADVLPAEEAEFFLQQIRRTLRSNQTQIVERKRLINNSTVWFEARISPLDENTVFLIARDITVRKNHEARISESESRYRDLFENANDIIYTLDLNGNYTSLNKAGERITGYTETEVVGTNFARTIQPEYLEIAKQNLAEKFVGEKTSTVYEIGIVAKDNSPILLETSTRLIRRDGEIVGVQGISREIGERKRHEQALQESEARYRRLVELSPDAIIIHRGETIVYSNSAGAKLHGVAAAADLIGRSVLDFVAPEKRAAAARSLEKAQTGGDAEPVRNFSQTIVRADQRIIEVEASAITILYEGEWAAQIVLRDVTARKRLEDQLRQAQKLESVGQLAAGIAHEINTPLQYVGDNTRFLNGAFADLNRAFDKYGELLDACRTRRAAAGHDDCHDAPRIRQTIAQVEEALRDCDIEYLAAEIPRAIAQSLDGIERVTKIVQSMRDFAHPGSIKMESIDLNRSIESTITVASNEWKRVAELETRFDEQLPPIACAGGEINQVVLNLIINAVHAVGEANGDGATQKGRIIVETRRAGADWAEVRVSDSGAGIPPAIRDRIFDPFFTTKPVGKGTGQGLAISRRLIAKHNGSLTFETEIGRGTTFIIKLPINGCPKNSAAIHAAVQTAAERIILN